MNGFFDIDSYVIDVHFQVQVQVQVQGQIQKPNSICLFEFDI